VAISDAAQIIANAFKLEKGIEWETTKSDGLLRMTSSNRKLKNYLPYFKFSPFAETLTASVEWFINNYDAARK